MSEITPKGTQINVLALHPVGHNVVLGTAGSGKTTMAMLWAKKVATTFPNQRVLLLTFNKALLGYMNAVYDPLPRNVDIHNYHKFARGYLADVGKMHNHCILDSKTTKESIVQECIYQCRQEFGDISTYKRPVGVFLDEIKFIEQFGVNTLDNYMKIERIGRASANIKRDNRPYFFAVYEKYLIERGKRAFQYDWDDLALYTYNALLEDKRERFYSHIVVDEGQDFSPMMLRSLIAAIPENGSFMFFGDVAQQIYGSRLSWRYAGINVQESRIYRFSDNYRNSIEVANFASDIMSHKYWDASDDLVKPSLVMANGPKPVLVEFTSESDETAWIIETIAQLAQTASCAVIVKNHAHVNSLMNILRNEHIKCQEIVGDSVFPNMRSGVFVTTFYSAKGLEFDNVFIPNLTSDYMPDAERLERMSLENVCADDLKLLYVATTRAKRGLYMSYHGELTCLFPVDSPNYDRHSLVR